MRVRHVFGFLAIAVAIHAGCGGSVVSRNDAREDSGTRGGPNDADGGPGEGGGSTEPPGGDGGAPEAPSVEAGPAIEPIQRCSTDADCTRPEHCVSILLSDVTLSICGRDCMIELRLDGSYGRGSCPLGEICDPGTNTCARECTPFSQPAGCSAIDGCAPIYDQPTAICQPAGTLTEGASCEHGACGPGLVCRRASLSLGGLHCQRLCSEDVPGAECPGQSKCRTVGSGYYGHVCSDECNPFAASDGCSGEKECFPFDELSIEPLARFLDGRCILPGRLNEGASCERNSSDCGSGLVCLAAPGPFTGPDACRRFCNPDQAGACSSGETCVRYRYTGDTALGTCLRTCTPWTADPVAAECAGGEWCAPNDETPEIGVCSLERPGLTLGETCFGDADCSTGLLCNGRCRTACSTSAAPGASGACGPSQTCKPRPGTDPPSQVGTCHDTCDFDGGIPCGESWETCVPHELTGTTADDCLDLPVMPPDDNCWSTTLFSGAVCRPLGICSVNGPCRPACRLSLGGVGTNPHPDCPAELPECGPDEGLVVDSVVGYGFCF